jgi:hypothetical protein
MKTLLIPALTAIVSLNTFATTSNVKFIATDYSAETQVCLAAAQNGLTSAEDKAKELGINYIGLQYIIQCNGKSLIKFSKTPKKVAEIAEIELVVTKPQYKFVTTNKNKASKICADAAINGFNFVNENYSDVRYIVCNGQNIVRFAKKYKS